jgi:hypothetical protein
MRRAVRSLAVVGVLAALVAPVVADRDSFPLSIYPMYARNRSTEVSFVTAQGVRADDRLTTLSLGVIGNSDDPLVVAGELRAALRRDEADARCREIADRVRDDTIDSVEVVTERHDTVLRLEGGDSLVRRTVHARCPVRG